MEFALVNTIHCSLPKNILLRNGYFDFTGLKYSEFFLLLKMTGDCQKFAQKMKIFERFLYLLDQDLRSPVRKQENAFKKINIFSLVCFL